ncbi:MAG TPA: GIY-YIG nuclease family protein [Cyclobacteriaceae bacterium]|nr:GIY-YIG nuclease family protein [Cyclobacteriaceae bacterium]
MYTVYAIRSLTKNYIYVGLSSDVSKRVERHNKGYERTTKPYRPFELFYTEDHPDRISARRREKFLKSGKGKAFLKSLIPISQ